MRTFAPPLGRIVLNLGPVERIPLGEGRAVRAGHLAIAVFRTRSGEVFVTDAACPHRGGPLADGTIGGGKVVCPLHACAFHLETGSPAASGCGPVKTYPSRVSQSGDILVGVD